MKRLFISRMVVAVLVVIPFGAPAAETNHNFAVWENEVRAYERNDVTNPPPRNAVLFVGSSGIRLWKTLASDFPDQKVINRGVGGCEIVDVTHFADRILFPYAPRVIVFRCGGNDLWNGKSAEAVARDFDEFVNAVHAKLPGTTILFVSWNPTIARWKNSAKEKDFNDRVKNYVEGKPYMKYIEAYDLVLDGYGQPRADLLAADKLHFSHAGYELLTKRVRAALAGVSQ